jgi:hypothetical protein
MGRRVMQKHQLIGAECERRISATRVIAELDFVYAGRQTFHNRADLPSSQPFSRERPQEGQQLITTRCQA